MISAEEARRLALQHKQYHDLEYDDRYVCKRIQELARLGDFSYETLTKWISPHLRETLKQQGFKVKRYWYFPAMTKISWK